MVLILTGHSGAGKDTVSNALQEKGYFTAITPHSTRAMRTGEVEGNPYFFITVPEFKNMADTGKFIEYASYTTQFDGVEDTAYYGTAYTSIPEGCDSIVTIGVLAGLELKVWLGEQAILVYLHVDDATREARAKARGSFDLTEWDNRLKQDHERFANGLPNGIDIRIDNMQSLELTVAVILTHLKVTNESN